MLGVVGRHYGFGSDDLLGMSVPDLMMWMGCIVAARRLER